MEKLFKIVSEILMISFLLVYILSFTHAAFLSPKTSVSPASGQNLTLFIENSTPLTDPKLYYKESSESMWSTQNISSPNVSASIAGKKLGRESVYEFYFNDTSLRFPKGNATFKIGLSVGDRDLEEIAGNLTNTNPANDLDGFGCRPWNSDYSCDYETYQSWMILAYTYGYYMSGNDTYKQILVNLSLSTIGSGFTDTCDHAKGDFDCNASWNPGAMNITASLRQGMLIYSLWSAYQVTEDESIKELALNYTNGHAEDCNVWTHDFNCSDPEGQGSMTLGYWKAYEQTGNDTYRDIAVNLSSKALGMNKSVYIALGLWKGYEMTDNRSYREKAVNITSTSGNTSTLNHSLKILTLIEGYEQTGDYELMSKAYAESRDYINCCPWNNSFDCGTPEEQGSAIFAFWRLYQVTPAKTQGIYAPRIKSIPQVGNDLEVGISFRGLLMDPRIYYKGINESIFSVCDISLNEGGCTIPRTDINRQSVYEFYFNDTDLRFPKGNATFKIGLSVGDRDLEEIAGNLTNTNPANDLDGFGCQPWNSDYSCDYETYQSWMILAYTYGYYMSGNDTYRQMLVDLSLSEIGGGFTETCDHADGDFDCNTSSPVIGDITASLRQGMLIYSLWSAYQVTEDESIKELALNYTNGHAEDCDVWTHDFNCSDPEGQGSMTLGYWKAYEQTGNDTYRDIAVNLSLKALGMNKSAYIALGLWKGYEMTDNRSYREKAVNISNTYSSASSPALNHSLKILTLIEGYEQTGDYELMSRAHINSLNYSGCDPWNNSFDCGTPEEQGSTIFAFWRLYQTYNTSDILYMEFDAPSRVEKGTTFAIDATISNIGDKLIRNVSVNLTLSSGLDTGDDTLVYYDNLSTGENRTISWDIESVNEGDWTLNCSVTSSVGELFESRVVEVYYEEEEYYSGGGGGGGGGASSFQMITYNLEFGEENYTFENEMLSEDVTDLLNKNKELVEFLNLSSEDVKRASDATSQVALDILGVRRFEKNYRFSTLTLTLKYSGNTTVDGFVVYDELSHLFASSPEEVDIYCPGADYFTLDENPLTYVFIYGKLVPGELKTITYTTKPGSNPLEEINKPFILGQDIVRLKIRDRTPPQCGDNNTRQ